MLGLLALATSTMLVLGNEFIQENLTEEMDSLNAQYNLVGFQELAVEEASSEFTYLFDSSALKANVINPKKPLQDLIVKINSDGSRNLKDIFVLKFQTDANIDKIAEDYSNLSGIKYAEPNFEFGMIQDEEGVKSKQKTSKNKESDSEKIIVALIDSGVDTKNRELKGKLVEGFDFIKNKKEVSDENGHGTHVAGILAGNSSSSLIMPLKVSDGKNVKLSNVVKAVKYAADNGTKIINLSLGLKAESKALKEAVKYAVEKDVILVAAAGNENSSEKFFPAALPEVIAVAAINNQDEKVFISNFGDWVDFSGKGQDVLSLDLEGGYVYKTGTSQAAPLVSAKIADLYLKENFDLEKTMSALKKLSKKPSGKYADSLGMVIE
jgi:subtilisin family serine protease